MTREEIEATIKEHLHDINIGAVFSTRTKLYKALGLPIDKQDGNKTFRSVVSMYIKWEPMENEGEKRSRKIRITEIIENPEYEDGRKNNGGARNIKYAKIIKAALVNYNRYGYFITYFQIFNKIFGLSIYERSKFDIVYRGNKHVKKYLDDLTMKLREITNSALDGLSREGYLDYRKVIVIKPGDRNFCPIGENTELDKISLSDLLQELFGSEAITIEQKFVTFFEETICLLESQDKRQKIVNKLRDAVSNMSKLTIAQFVNCVFTDRDLRENVENYLVSLQKFDQNREDYDIATEEVETTINHIVEITLAERGYNAAEMVLNRNKSNAVYNRAHLIQLLFGWEQVYKALTIRLNDLINAREEYPVGTFSQVRLLEVLEPFIIEKVISTVANPHKIYEQNRGKRKGYRPLPSAAGFPNPINFEPDIDIHYLVDDKEVNLLHCEIFHHTPDENYFRPFLEMSLKDKQPG